jgi:hypothetical protein
MDRPTTIKTKQTCTTYAILLLIIAYAHSHNQQICLNKPREHNAEIFNVIAVVRILTTAQ